MHADPTPDRTEKVEEEGVRVGDLVKKAEAALERGDHAEAIRIYRQLHAARPDDADILLGLGRALTAAERYSEAEALFRDMQERGVEPIDAHLGIARILLARGDLQGAERMYRNVMQADGGNLQARIAIAEIKHRRGLDRTAREQADNIVLDHPESREARALQRRIHEALRPRVTLDPSRYSDSDGNRVDAGTAAVTFMAEPQTAIRIAYSGHTAEFRCTDVSRCAEVAQGPSVDRIIAAEAQTLTAGLTSRLIQPLSFHARAGAVRQESFDSDVRYVVVGGGFVDWQVGPQFGLRATGGREALLDTAPIIDRGLRLDTADLGLAYSFADDWLLTGHAEFGSYSDGNARKTATAALEWRLARERPRVAATVDARYRTFNDDRDGGYFDPLHYDSGRLTIAVGEENPGGRVFWGLEGTLGLQEFDTESDARLEADPDRTIRAVRASAGVRLGSRGRLEVFYSRTNDALHSAIGFTASRAGIALRIRG